MAGRGHETLAHTADMGLRGWGPDPAAAMEETAAAMFELSVDSEGTVPEVETEIEAAGRSMSELLVEFLNELISTADINEVLFTEVEVGPIRESKGVFSAAAKARGIRRAGAGDRIRSEVKAATWYGAFMKETGKGRWTGQCVVDM